ncbi:MAG TPA: aminotransferase class IV, partial [Candidatus Goldiibacteriota bacterium]|nr:aminotransferase class IV [Candidatus Goldiibacteriota bacterium]
MLVNLNGKLVQREDAKVSVFDHGLLYGDGVFEGIRVYDGNIFKLEEHINRLYNSAKFIMLNIGISKEQMIKETVRLVAVSKIRNGYIRLVVTRGEGDLGLDPKNCAKSTYFIIIDNIKLYPEEFYKKGLEIATVATRRNISESLNPQVKSLNYLNNILAKIEANNQDSFEAVMVNEQGYVTEATGDNIFIVKDGKLLTPPTFIGVLGGITRDSVIDTARKLKIET